MTTPHTSSTPHQPDGEGSLRLRLADPASRADNQLDGGWWPHSRDLPVELAQLVDDFPPERGRVVRAHYSPPDWEAPPRRIPVRGGWIKVGGFPRDDTHLMVVKTSDRLELRLLVIPPDFTTDQGEEALLAASTSANTHSAASVLHAVTDQHDVDRDDLWTDGQESRA